MSNPITDILGQTTTAPENSATIELLKDVYNDITGGATSAAVDFLWSLICGAGGNSDAAALSQISGQLSSIQQAIANLPQAVTSYSAYYNAISTANAKVANLAQVASTIALDSQWMSFVDFLTPGSQAGDDYTSLTNNILLAAYGTSLAQLAGSTPFGSNAEAYANYLNNNTYLNQTTFAISDFINANSRILLTVESTCSAVASLAQTIYQQLKTLSGNTATFSALQSSTQTAINQLLNDSALAKDLVPTAGTHGSSPFYTNLCNTLNNNVLNYFCGNAAPVYQKLKTGGGATIKCNGNGQYIANGEPKGAGIIDPIKGICDYWTTQFQSAPYSCFIEFTKDYSVTDATYISGGDAGKLYIGAGLYMTPVNSTEFIGDSVTRAWQILLSPVNQTTATAGSFNFVIQGINDPTTNTLYNDSGSPGTGNFVAQPNYMWTIQ